MSKPLSALYPADLKKEMKCSMCDKTFVPESGTDAMIKMCPTCVAAIMCDSENEEESDKHSDQDSQSDQSNQSDSEEEDANGMCMMHARA